MKNHEYIKSICLLGVDRKQLEQNKLSEPLDTAIKQVADKDQAEMILHALILNHYYHIAAQELQSINKEITHAPIVEELAYAPEAYHTILKQILDIDKQHTQTSLLAIWINKLRDSSLIVHPIYLVKYLNALLGVTNDLKIRAVSTFGKKGLWLCQQNPKYDKLLNQEIADVWSFGTSHQRREHLETMLYTDPDAALRMVKESWNTENAKEKLKHLTLLLSHTHPNQIDFVQELYSEEFAYTKKESVTHRKSRNILSKILLLNESSELHQQTVVQLAAYTTGKKKGLLSRVRQGNGEVINIPESEDSFFNGQHMLETYGIDIQSTKASEYKTDQTYWFSELVGAIPFDVWSKMSGTKPAVVLKEFLESDKYLIVVNNKKISGLQDAIFELVEWYGQDEYTLAVIDQFKGSGAQKVLVSMLSPKAWSNYLSKHLDIIDNEVLSECPHRKNEMWSLDFSKTLLTHTVDRLNTSYFDYHIGLTMAAYIPYGAITHLTKLNNEKALKSTHYQYWKKHIYDPIYQTVSIKHQIHKL